jgi:ribosome-associated protein
MSASKSSASKPTSANKKTTAKTKSASKTVKPKTASKGATMGGPKASAAKRPSVSSSPKSTRARVTKNSVSKPRVAKAKMRKSTASVSAFERLLESVRAALVDMKALSLIELDVKGQSDVTDTVLIASGTSDRHVKAIADRVRSNAKAAGFRVLGVEGEREGEWVLIDLGDAIVHVMLPRIRELYALERLWSVKVEER